MSALADRSLPRAVRLRRSEDFRRVLRTGRRAGVPHLRVQWCDNGLEGPRFGLAVSRRVGNAVVRNRVKRWLREAIRHERSGLPPVDVVFVARPDAARVGYEGLRASVRQAFQRIGSEAR